MVVTWWELFGLLSKRHCSNDVTYFLGHIVQSPGDTSSMWFCSSWFIRNGQSAAKSISLRLWYLLASNFASEASKTLGTQWNDSLCSREMSVSAKSYRVRGDQLAGYGLPAEIKVTWCLLNIRQFACFTVEKQLHCCRRNIEMHYKVKKWHMDKTDIHLNLINICSQLILKCRHLNFRVK